MLFFLSLKIWHLGDAKVVRQIDHPDKITTVIFTQDSNHVITGGEDNSCKIWEISTGKLIQVYI
jgi:WD40 repeat protein